MDNYIINDIFEFQGSEIIGNKLQDFEILQTLGKGSFGFVAKVKSRINSKLYAMKMMNFDLIKEPNARQLSLNEIQIINSLNNQHIVKYYNCFQDGNKLYIIMEFMNNGDLKGFIEAHKNMNDPIPENELWELFYQCASALCYIHKTNLIHRDIKPANLFLTDDKAVKIGDFGVSSFKKNILTTARPEDLVVGTPIYMAPEMYQGQYGNKVDVYALGFTFHNLCYYDNPREYEIKTINQVTKCNLLDVTPKYNTNLYSREIKCLIDNMIKRNPNERWTSFQVLEHIKKIYNQKYQQNRSIDCIFRCFFSLKYLINYMNNNSSIINSNYAVRPIFATLISSLKKINDNNWATQLNDIRDVLLFQNPCLTDPGEMDPIDLLQFMLESMHKESRPNNNVNDKPYFTTQENKINDFSNTLNIYMNSFNSYKSFVSDCFCGTHQVTRSCPFCRNRTVLFHNFLYTIFNIDEFIKNGLNGCDLPALFLKQNSILKNKSIPCCVCGQIANKQEMKTFFTLPFILIICFQGNKKFYGGQYVRYPLFLDLSCLGLKSGPTKYNLKGIIKSCLMNDKKIYTCIYKDLFLNRWIVSDGYSKGFVNSPYDNNVGDVVMLFYDSFN